MTPVEGVICPDCEHLNAAGRSSCAACGTSLAHRERAPAPVGPTNVARLRLSRTELDRLWSVWERLLTVADPAAWFPGAIAWPDADEPLCQTLPEGTRLLTHAPGSVPPARLVSELATAAELLHAAGFRFNCLHPGALIVGKDGRFAGVVLPACLTDLAATAEAVPTGELHCGFAPPELRKFVPAAPGAATDVFVLAALYHALATRRPVEDLMRTGFRLLAPDDPLGPAVRLALSEALAPDPATRTPSPGAFADALRRAIIADAAACDLIASAAGLSDIGLGGRTANEDAFAICLTAIGGSSGASVRGAVAVADGMGGLKFGDQASRLCAAAAEDAARELPALLAEGPNPDAWTARASEWAHGVNRAVLATGDRNRAGRNFGSTLTALFVLGRRAVLVHAGDSRLFRVRDGRAERLSEVQTYAAALHARGELTAEEMETSTFKNTLTNHVGSETFAPQVEVLDIRPGDVYLLCSDGPLDGLTLTDLADVLGTSPPDDAVNELMRRAKCALRARPSDSDAPDGNPSSDNLTLVAVRFAAAPPCPGDEPCPPRSI